MKSIGYTVERKNLAGIVANETFELTWQGVIYTGERGYPPLAEISLKFAFRY